MVRKKKPDIIKTLIGDELNLNNESLLKSIAYYKKASEIIARTDKALGRRKEYSETTQSTIDLNISQDAIGSTTDF